MIHIATVHWMTDRWIDVQLHYLEKNVDTPYRIYAGLSGAAMRHANRFFSTFEAKAPTGQRQSVSRSHSESLKYLADEIRQAAAPEDVLLFLDGDAFPVAKLSAP